NPVRIAENWAMVDVVSNGRLDWGAGRGYQPREFAMLGADPTVSRDVFAEALDVVLGLWNTDGPFSYRGRYFQINGIEIFPKPVQRPLPVWVAALSPPTFQLIAEKGLQVITTPTLMPMEQLKEQVVLAAQTLVARGRPPESIDFPLSMVTHVAPTVEEA